MHDTQKTAISVKWTLLVLFDTSTVVQGGIEDHLGNFKYFNKLLI